MKRKAKRALWQCSNEQWLVGYAVLKSTSSLDFTFIYDHTIIFFLESCTRTIVRHLLTLTVFISKTDTNFKSLKTRFT